MEYKRRYEALQVKVQEIKQSAELTQIGKEQAISEAVKGFEPTAQTYHDKAVQTIDAAIEARTAQWKKRSTEHLQDAGYQSGIANVIKMLELGAVTEPDDIQNIIDAYTGDYKALAIIKKIMQASDDRNIQACLHMVPEDTRERNKQLLAQLRRNVDARINVSTIQTSSKAWNTFNQCKMSSFSHIYTMELYDIAEKSRHSVLKGE